MLPVFDWSLAPPWIRRFGPLKLVPGPLLDRVTLHYFASFSAFSGVLGGVYALSAMVLKKTLHANAFQVATFTALGPIALLIGIFGSELVQDRDKRPFILWVGMISRGLFLLYIFSSHIWSFLAISALYFILNALLTPATYALWQANVSADNRNRMWGLLSVIATLVTIACTFLSGIILDGDPWSYRWMYALGGLLGMVAIYILYRMPIRGQYKLSSVPAPLTFHSVVVRPVKTFTSLLWSDREYLHFESAYFLYGVAFMLMTPAMPLYMVDVAKMSYTEMGIATGLLLQLGMIFAAVYWGRLMDIVGPARQCAVVFFILAFFPIVLLLGPAMQKLGMPLTYNVYLGYVIFGLGMAGIQISWSLGPVSFAGDRDASNYLGAHVTLTGLRGSIAPMLGAIGLNAFGYRVVFITSAVFFILGSLGMVHLAWRQARAVYRRAAISPATDG